MSFVLALHETPGRGLERVIDEQTVKLAAECADAFENASAFAHKARVRAKRVRAALRLARPLMGSKKFRTQNRWWRDAGRMLSDLRDAGARLEALSALEPFLVAKMGTAMTRKLGEKFERDRRTVDAVQAIDTFRDAFTQRRSELVPDLVAGKREDMIEALGDTYRAGRITMKAALEDEDPLLLHEWRKQTKYHALQARLLRLTFPVALGERAGGSRELAAVLGEVQDLEIVAEGAKDWTDAPDGFLGVLTARRNALVGEARAAGDRLFSQKTKPWMRTLSEVQSAPPPPLPAQDA